LVNPGRTEEKIRVVTRSHNRKELLNVSFTGFRGLGEEKRERMLKWVDQKVLLLHVLSECFLIILTMMKSGGGVCICFHHGRNTRFQYNREVKHTTCVAKMK
jgi:hypothetical protein